MISGAPDYITPGIHPVTPTHLLHTSHPLHTLRPPLLPPKLYPGFHFSVRHKLGRGSEQGPADSHPKLRSCAPKSCARTVVKPARHPQRNLAPAPRRCIQECQSYILLLKKTTGLPVSWLWRVVLMPHSAQAQI